MPYSVHTAENTRHVWGRITAQLISSLTGLDSEVLKHTCLVKPNPVKLDTSYTVIVPPSVSVLFTLVSLIYTRWGFFLSHKLMLADLVYELGGNKHIYKQLV